MNSNIATEVTAPKKGITVNVYVQPGSAKSGCTGVHGDRLRIKVTGKALQGAANDAVLEFFSSCFAVSKSRVSIVRGEKSRQKTIFIEGEAASLLRKLHELRDGRR